MRKRGQWEEVEPSEDVQTDVRTECVVNDHMSSLSTIEHNSDIADMGDFSDEENEQWEEVETSEDVQTEVRTGGVDNNASVTFWGLSYIIDVDGVSYIFGGRGLS